MPKEPSSATCKRCAGCRTSAVRRCRHAYIDLDPVRANLCKDPKDYRFCGYAEGCDYERSFRRILLALTSSARAQRNGLRTRGGFSSRGADFVPHSRNFAEPGGLFTRINVRKTSNGKSATRCCVLFRLLGTSDRASSGTGIYVHLPSFMFRRSLSSLSEIPIYRLDRDVRRLIPSRSLRSLRNMDFLEFPNRSQVPNGFRPHISA